MDGVEKVASYLAKQILDAGKLKRGLSQYICFCQAFSVTEGVEKKREIYGESTIQR